MPIKVSCGGCSASLSAPDSAAGKKVKCPKCQAVLAVPAPEPEVPKFEVVEPERLPPLRRQIRAEEEDDDAPAKLEREDRPARPKPLSRRDDDDEDDRPRKRRDDDEDDDRPRARKRRDYDDEDDRPRRRDDDYEPRRKAPRGGRKRKRKSGGNPLGWLSSPAALGIFALLVGVAWLAALLIGLVAPAAFVVSGLLGYLAIFAGGIWLMIIAFSDSVQEGLMCMFLPLYGLIYITNNWDTCQSAFLMQVAGWIMVVITFLVAG